MATKGYRVHVWARSESEAFEHNHETGHHDNISFTSSPPEAVEDANLIILAVPAQSIRQNIRMFRDWLDPTTILVNAAKGIEIGTGKRMSEVLQDEIEPALWKKTSVLSGPNLAREIYQGLPAAAILASRETRTALSAQELLTAPNFRVFTSSDVIGVELAGALKNVIALGAGIIDGLELGDNAKGAFICIGWAEMVAIGTTLGADPATFYGLAGLGDLFATCASPLSRNHTAGYDLGRGKKLSEILAATPHVAEGVDTTVGLTNMSKRLKVDMPITLLIHRVLFGGLPPAEAVLEFKKLIAKQPAAAVTSPQRYL
jgi:glycerol-3-phosphate dehydrogenase (NAD(P)+)